MPATSAAATILPRAAPDPPPLMIALRHPSADGRRGANRRRGADGRRPDRACTSGVGVPGPYAT
ncbi:hypothetical protein D7193_10110 [Micromonospora costi]|uniref:Uncharacterized protein n=1 Tax=Micromonospora costi TaxID=1530042 RepID=A0A3B0AEI6_9ACTN|nr:hypothetical protein D7193_10110 [Micromonospora costi]